MVRTWDVSPRIAGPGDYEVTFRFTGGKSRLDMRNVELLLNGTRVAIDAHEGRTGAEHKDNVYRLSLKECPEKVRLTLRAEVRTDGDNNSSGNIFLRKVR